VGLDLGLVSADFPSVNVALLAYPSLASPLLEIAFALGG
jgi:hypothetical protein